MSIAFESDEIQLRKLRERLRLMSDEELIQFAKDVGKLSEPRGSPYPDLWKPQSKAALVL
jgi:hypothetical protein